MGVKESQYSNLCLLASHAVLCESSHLEANNDFEYMLSLFFWSQTLLSMEIYTILSINHSCHKAEKLGFGVIVNSCLIYCHHSYYIGFFFTLFDQILFASFHVSVNRHVTHATHFSVVQYAV